MSKRSNAYRNGLERFFKYMEMFLNEGSLPTHDEIEEELRAIEALHPVSFSIHFPDSPIDPENGYIMLIGEEFDRYDDILPEILQIFILPAAMDVSKEINRYLTQLPIH